MKAAFQNDDFIIIILPVEVLIANTEIGIQTSPEDMAK